MLKDIKKNMTDIELIHALEIELNKKATLLDDISKISYYEYFKKDFSFYIENDHVKVLAIINTQTNPLAVQLIEKFCFLETVYLINCNLEIPPRFKKS